jgi:hypothetical protein
MNDKCILLSRNDYPNQRMRWATDILIAARANEICLDCGGLAVEVHCYLCGAFK